MIGVGVITLLTTQVTSLLSRNQFLNLISLIAAQKRNVNGMGRVSEEIGAQIVVSLGDNFYNTGVSDEDVELRYKHTFEEVFASHLSPANRFSGVQPLRIGRITLVCSGWQSRLLRQC